MPPIEDYGSARRRRYGVSGRLENRLLQQNTSETYHTKFPKPNESHRGRGRGHHPYFRGTRRSESGSQGITHKGQEHGTDSGSELARLTEFVDKEGQIIRSPARYDRQCWRVIKNWKLTFTSLGEPVYAVPRWGGEIDMVEAAVVMVNENGQRLAPDRPLPNVYGPSKEQTWAMYQQRKQAAANAKNKQETPALRDNQSSISTFASQNSNKKRQREDDLTKADATKPAPQAGFQGSSYPPNKKVKTGSVPAQKENFNLENVEGTKLSSPPALVKDESGMAQAQADSEKTKDQSGKTTHDMKVSMKNSRENPIILTEEATNIKPSQIEQAHSVPPPLPPREPLKSGNEITSDRTKPVVLIEKAVGTKTTTSETALNETSLSLAADEENHPAPHPQPPPAPARKTKANGLNFEQKALPSNADQADSEDELANSVSGSRNLPVSITPKASKSTSDISPPLKARAVRATRRAPEPSFEIPLEQEGQTLVLAFVDGQPEPDVKCTLVTSYGIALVKKDGFLIIIDPANISKLVWSSDGAAVKIFTGPATDSTSSWTYLDYGTRGLMNLFRTHFRLMFGESSFLSESRSFRELRATLPMDEAKQIAMKQKRPASSVDNGASEAEIQNCIKDATIDDIRKTDSSASKRRKLTQQLQPDTTSTNISSKDNLAVKATESTGPEHTDPKVKTIDAPQKDVDSAQQYQRRQLRRKPATRKNYSEEPPPKKYSETIGLGDPWDKALVYPAQGKNKTTVEYSDLLRLDDGEYLNDNIISFYIRYLQEEATKSEKKIYVFNTYFYESLTKDVKTKTGINYEAVKRWTSKVDLFEYDYVVVPINEHLHWYVAIICNPNKIEEDPNAKSNENSGRRATIQKPATRLQGTNDQPALIDLESDEHRSENRSTVTGDTKPDLKVTQKPDHQRKDAIQSSADAPKEPRLIDIPAILTLDSFGESHTPVVRNLKDYLWEEAKAKRHIEIAGPRGVTGKGLPLQNNHCDCGVFLLGYIAKFLSNPDAFIQKMLARSMNTKTDWPEFKASVMRDQIRNIIMTKHDELVLKKPSPLKQNSPAGKKNDDPITMDPLLHLTGSMKVSVGSNHNESTSETSINDTSTSTGSSNMTTPSRASPVLADDAGQASRDVNDGAGDMPNQNPPSGQLEREISNQVESMGLGESAPTTTMGSGKDDTKKTESGTLSTDSQLPQLLKDSEIELIRDQAAQSTESVLEHLQGDPKPGNKHMAAKDVPRPPTRGKR